MADTPSIVPDLSYRDPRAAIAFLTGALGLSVVQMQKDVDAVVQHAEPAHGNGVVMPGTADLPKGSPGICPVVADADARHARAVAAGADPVHPLEDTGRGARRWRARDPEGHEWSVGTYAPGAEPPAWG